MASQVGAAAPDGDNPHLAIMQKFSRKAEEERQIEQERKRLEGTMLESKKVQEAVIQDGANLHHVILARYAERKRQQELAEQEKRAQLEQRHSRRNSAKSEEIIERPPGPVLETLTASVDVHAGGQGHVGRRRISMEDRSPLTLFFFELGEDDTPAKVPCDTLVLGPATLLFDNIPVATDSKHAQTQAKKQSVFQTIRNATVRSARAFKVTEVPTAMIETGSASFYLTFGSVAERSAWHSATQAFFSKYSILGEAPKRSLSLDETSMKLGEEGDASPSQTRRSSTPAGRRSSKARPIFAALESDVLVNPLAEEVEPDAVFNNELFGQL